MGQVTGKHWFLLAGLLLTAALGAVALLWQPVPVGEGLPRQEGTASLPEEPAAAQVPPYRIAVWQGHVAVFEGAEPLPATVLETPAASLPQADRQALERGIPVYSREELACLLEDYGS